MKQPFSASAVPNPTGTSALSVPPDSLSQQIVASAMAGLVSLDREFRIIAWNPAMEALTRLQAGEALGRGLLDVLPVFQECGGETLLRRALAGEEMIAPDLRCAAFTRQGEPAWVGSCFTPLRAVDGAILGVLVSVSDITERKAAEEKLAQSEERFRSLIELAVDAIFLQDSEGNFLNANHRACEVTGYAPDEVRRMKMHDLFQADELLRQPLRPDLLRQGQTVVSRRALKRKDGRLVPIEMTSRMMPDGTIQTFLRDISEREQATQDVAEAQRRFETVIQNSPLIVAQGMDRRGVILHWNEASTRLYNLRPEQAIGQRMQDLLLDRPESEEFEEMLEDVWFTRQPGNAHEWRVVPPDGRVRWVYSTLFPILERGEVTEVFCVDVDVTDRKRAEESLQQSEAKLRSVFNTIPYPIFAKDTNLRYNECNRAFMEYLGLGRDQIIGKTVFDIAPHDKADIYHRADVELLEHGGCQTYETTVKSSSGLDHDVILHKGVYFSSDGRPAGMVGVVVDITERKQAQQALLEGERRFRTVYDSVNDAIFIHDAETGRVLDVNARTCELYGRTHEEMIQATPDECSSGEPPYSAAEAIAWLRKASAGEPQLFEWLARARDGRLFWVEVSMRAAEIRGQRIVLVVVRDISERKRAEKALTTMSSRFRSLFNNMAEGVALHQTLLGEDQRPANYRILDVNPAYEKILQFQREKVVGRLATEVYQTEQPPYLERFTRVGETGVPDHFETYFPPMQRHFSISVIPTGPHRWGTIFSDITERKRVEQAMQEAELRYRTLFENSPVGIYRTTRDGHILLANPALIRILGFSTFEDLSRRNLEQEGFANPADRADFLARIEAENEVEGYETQWVKKDGAAIILRESARAVRGTDGAVLYYEGTVEDITAAKRAEADLRLKDHAIGSAINAIVMADTIGRLTYVNPAFLKLWGYDDTGEVLGRSAVEFWQIPAEASHVIEVLLEKGVWVGELDAQRKDGSRFVAHLTANLVRDERGRPLCMMGSFANVTEHKELEARLRQAQKLEGIGQLAGGVAHDFNNILTVILGNASVLKTEAGLGPEAAELLREISEAGERAANLTRQLLAFSRKQPMKPGPLDLNEVVSGLTKMLRRMIGEDIDLECHYVSSALPITGDPVMLGQVLMNLAVNARDAMPRGGRLMISTESVRVSPDHVLSQPAAREGRFARLSVRDTGTGIQAETIAHIFEPFFTTKEVGKGTGLGLATAYGIIQQHTGWIEVESAPGTGTTFFIFLPLDDSAAIVQSRAPAAPAIAGGKETILVVEDEPGVRSLARLCLQRYGYHVIEAEDGPEALAAWERAQGKVDLLLTDMVMPGGMSGRDLANLLWKYYPTLKVIFSSGYSTDLPDQDDLGPNTAFLAKPYEIGLLVRTVRDFLDGKLGPPCA